MNKLSVSTSIIDAPGFYGWKILAIVFLAQMLAMGTTVYGFGVFVKPLTEEFGVSRATLNQGFVVFMIGMGLFSPLLGRLLDRYRIRYIMAAGAALMGIGFCALGICKTLDQMALVVALPIALGAAAIGPLVASTLVANWFSRQRGRALGISSAATSLGGALVVPLAAVCVEQFGWRAALVAQGAVIAAVIGLLALAFIHNHPRDIDLQPDGDSAPPDIGKTAAEQTQAQSWWRSRNFWCITLSVGLCFAINQAFLVSLIPYATDLGIGLKQATLLLSCSSVASIAGKLVIGACADRVEKRFLMLLVIACIILQMAVLIFEPGYGVLLIICTLAGFAIGGELPVWGALVAECFGSARYGSVMGAMSAANTALGLTAVHFIGAMFDRNGNYAFAFQLFIGIALIAGVFAAFIRSPARS